MLVLRCPRSYTNGYYTIRILMSTTLYKSSNTVRINYDKSLRVSKKRQKYDVNREALADFVRKRVDELGGYRQVAETGGVSHGTIGNIITQRNKDIKFETLTDVANGLGVNPLDMFAAAYGLTSEPKRLQDEFKALLLDFDSLADTDKALLKPGVEVLSAMIRARLELQEKPPEKVVPLRQNPAPPETEARPAAQDALCFDGAEPPIKIMPAQNLRDREVAEILSITPEVLQTFIRGRKLSSSEILEFIAEVLDCQPEQVADALGAIKAIEKKKRFNNR